MKIKLALILPLISVGVFSQELKQKEIEIIEEKEVKVRNVSFGVLGGAVMYYGEESTDLTFDYGVSLRKHINHKFDIDYNFHYGETKYVIDSLDFSETISYYGVNSTFNVNLVETFTKKDSYATISPYIGAGLGVMSSRPLNETKEFVFLYVPVSVGININPSDRLIVGLHATGRFLLSDNWDNSKVSSAKDFLFYPSASLRYVFGMKKKIKRNKGVRTISYKEDYQKSNKEYEKYDENANNIEPFLEISVKEFRDSSIGLANNDNLVISDIKQETNYLFYTIQVASFKTNTIDILEGAGVKEDFAFFNSKTNKYNYCKGFYASVSDAKADLKLIKKKNPLAFITAIHNNEKIKLYFANQRLELGKTKVDIEAAKKQYSK